MESDPNLLRVVIQGDESRVEEYLKRNSDLDPKELARTLWHCVRLGYLEMASLLVQRGADVNLKNPFDQSGSSFLHELLKSLDPRYYQLALQIMDYGADMNACNKDKESVLHRAIEEKKPIDIIEELMKRGARLKEFSYGAFKHPSAIEIVQLLLLHGNIDEFKSDVIGAAIRSSNIELVKLLIEYGFDFINPTKRETSPLFIASGLEKSDITELLIRIGARVDSYSGKPGSMDEGYAIHAACRKKSVKNIRVLLKHGVDINVTNSRGKTPFSLMYFNGYRTDAHRLVVKHFAVLTATERRVNDSDLTIVSNNRGMSSYYTECLNELTSIKGIKIIRDISFIKLFDNNIGELLFITRNCKFDGNICMEQWKVQFPIYYKEMISVFKNAERQKMFYSEREEAISESLKTTVPCLPLERIIYFVYIN